MALLEHLSTQSARELLVAVVPALVPRDAREVILDDSIEPLNRLNPAADCTCESAFAPSHQQRATHQLQFNGLDRPSSSWKRSNLASDTRKTYPTIHFRRFVTYSLGLVLISADIMLVVACHYRRGW